MFAVDGDPATEGMGTEEGGLLGFGPVYAGSYIALCGGTREGGEPQSNVQVRLIHGPTNSMLFAGTLMSVAACA